MDSYLLKMIGPRTVDPDELKGGEDTRGPKEIGVGGTAPANEGIDKMFLGGECDWPGAGPDLGNQMGNLRKTPRESRETAKIL